MQPVKQQLLQQQQLQQQQQQFRQKAQYMTFASTTDEILKKYSKYPASLTLHIFEKYYRFNNSQDSQIISKDSPMIKDFLKHVLKEEIPVEMCELLKDFSIKSYDGCLILQVYDHRNLNKSINESPTKNETNEQQIAKPKTYRTLLKPTPLSIYYDLLYHTDSALTKFTDTLSLQMESEILTLTNRKLDLSVPLNPYNYDYLKPLDHEESHRKSIEVPRRKIHQEEMVLHKSSEYEEIMLLLSNKYKRPDESQENKLVIVNSSSSLPVPSASSSVPPATSTKPSSKEGSVGIDSKKKNEKAVPAPTNSITQNPIRATGQFMRLRLIEEIRKKREAEKFQQDANIQAQANAANDVPQSLPANSTAVPEKRFQSPSIQQSAPKRIKKEPKKQMNSQPEPIPQQQPLPPQQSQPIQQPIQQSHSMMPQNSPQFNSNSNSQMPSASNTPMMRNNNVPFNQAPTPQMNNVPLQQPQQSQQQPQLSVQQQQYQQIFQNTLTPDEQQYFKQVQSKMQILAQMSQTGIAPNGQQLTPQQKQQALQQVKVMQQQLIQKFPVYFQRLKQFQIFQQKQKQLQQEKLQAAVNSNQIPNGMNQIPIQNQNQNQIQNQQFNIQPQAQNQQQMPGMNGEPKKKRAYRKKNSTSN